MADILQEFTIARRILPPESLPWAQLTLPTVIERFKERYRFEEVGRPEKENEGADASLVAGNGEFIVDNIPQAVQLFALEPNVVHTQTSGGGEISEALFEDFKNFILEIDPNRKIASEYIKTYQTIAIAQLRVPFDAMLSKKFLTFLESSATTRIGLPDATADISLSSLSFRVTYNTDNKEFGYLPKQLTLEPRSGSKLSDRIYYTQSPTDPATHRILIEEFERALES
jgi:hypothetical protein